MLSLLNVAIDFRRSISLRGDLTSATHLSHPVLKLKVINGDMMAKGKRKRQKRKKYY